MEDAGSTTAMFSLISGCCADTGRWSNTWCVFGKLFICLFINVNNPCSIRRLNKLKKKQVSLWRSELVAAAVNVENKVLLKSNIISKTTEGLLVE